MDNPRPICDFISERLEANPPPIDKDKSNDLECEIILKKSGIITRNIDAVSMLLYASIIAAEQSPELNNYIKKIYAEIKKEYGEVIS